MSTAPVTGFEAILPKITTAKLRAARRKPEARDLPESQAFTSAGPAKLGLADDAMATFPREFRMGIGENDERSGRFA